MQACLLYTSTSVLNNLDTEKYDVLPVGITKDGRWYLYSGPVEDLCSGAWQRHSGNAVSYTHLDVYKRQLYLRSNVFFG